MFLNERKNMPDNNSLINLGDLSKPATLLIEKISDAVGAIFQPWQIRRIADAEADAKAIHAVADIKIQELQKRALMRFIQEETRKQQNIESITAKAIPDLSDTANPRNIKNDWLLNFFDKCKTISDAEMQDIWARILVGEANAPGSYCRRTIETVSMLAKEDAQLFQNLCKFSWLIGKATPVIFNVEEMIYNSEGVNFNTLTHLDDIGLISFNSLSGYNRVKLPKRVKVDYFGKTCLLEFPKDADNQLPIGKILLSKVGQELATICLGESKDGFLEHVKTEWIKHGITIS